MRASLLRCGLIAVITTLAVTSSALAAKPTKVPLGAPPDPLTFPGGTGFCDFDISLTWTVNREFAIIFTYPDGSSLWRVAGSVEIVATNLETGASLPWNAGGPGLAAFDAGGNLTRFEGRGHVFIFGPLEPIQSNGIYEYIGNVDMLAGTHTGRRIDVCAALT